MTDDNEKGSDPQRLHGQDCFGCYFLLEKHIEVEPMLHSQQRKFWTDVRYPVDQEALGSAHVRGALTSTGQRETNLLGITFALIVSRY